MYNVENPADFEGLGGGQDGDHALFPKSAMLGLLLLCVCVCVCLFV